MVYITAGQGLGSQNQAQTSTVYTYLELAKPFVSGGYITDIWCYITTNNGTFRVGTADWAGTTAYPRKNYVTIDVTGDGTGWKHYSVSNGDFLPFYAHSGDCIIFHSDTDEVQLARSNTGGTNRYGYGAQNNDFMDSNSFSFTNTTTRWIEICMSGVTGYTLSGITYDKDGSEISDCNCHCCHYNDNNTCSWLAYTSSNSDGWYIFSSNLAYSSNLFVIAWKDDSPHIFDVTDWNLIAGEI